MKRTFLIYLLLVLTQGYYTQVWAETKYVDLGLPSGTKWAVENEEREYTFYEAVSVFPRQIPTLEQFSELFEECKYTAKKDGILLIGKNNNTIFLPKGDYNLVATGYYSSPYNDQYGIKFGIKRKKLEVSLARGEYLDEADREPMQVRLVLSPDTTPTPKIDSKAIDLKLPSGTKWEVLDRPSIDSVPYNDDNLPLRCEWNELLEECNWQWTGCGYLIKNKSGEGKTLYIHTGRIDNPDNPADYIFSHFRLNPYRNDTSINVESNPLRVRLIKPFTSYMLRRMPIEYVDMGLPSGTKWATYTKEHEITWQDAIGKYGTQIPTKEQFEELFQYCQFQFIELNQWDLVTLDIKPVFPIYCIVTAPNGHEIFMNWPVLWTRTSKNDNPNKVYGVKIQNNDITLFVNRKEDALGLLLVQ